MDLSFLNTSPKDSFIYTSYPEISRIKSSRLKLNENNTLIIVGRKFEYTTSVYLSSDQIGMFDRPLSSYEDFNGYELSSYDYYTTNLIYVTTPILNNVGNINVIIKNPSGYIVSDTIEVINI